MSHKTKQYSSAACSQISDVNPMQNPIGLFTRAIRSRAAGSKDGAVLVVIALSFSFENLKLPLPNSSYNITKAKRASDWLIQRLLFAHGCTLLTCVPMFTNQIF